jgi:hypothetical protein
MQHKQHKQQAVAMQQQQQAVAMQQQQQAAGSL